MTPFEPIAAAIYALLGAGAAALYDLAKHYVKARVLLAKGDTSVVEEEAQQRSLKAKAATAEKIEKIKEADVDNYGVMLQWMTDQLNEQVEQRRVLRSLLEGRIEQLTHDLDELRHDNGIQSEELARLRAQNEVCERELAELRLQITQNGITHREEQGVLRRKNDELRATNHRLFNENRRLGGSPSATDLAGIE